MGEWVHCGPNRAPHILSRSLYHLSCLEGTPLFLNYDMIIMFDFSIAKMFKIVMNVGLIKCLFVLIPAVINNVMISWSATFCKISIEAIHTNVAAQVGVGHNFTMQATGWKWKLTTCLGGDGISRIRNKTSVGLCPGFDLRFGWRADYVLPEINGQVSKSCNILISD